MVPGYEEGSGGAWRTTLARTGESDLPKALVVSAYRALALDRFVNGQILGAHPAHGVERVAQRSP